MRWRLPDNVHGYINRHGKAVFYLRLPGAKKIRLRAHPGSPEFMTAYEAARAGKESPALGAGRTIPGTVNAAIVGYYQSSSFKDGSRGGAKLITGTGIGSPSDPVSQNDDQAIEITMGGK